MNKCDGIKILELDPKRILEGDVVVAGTDNSVYICKDYTKFGTFEGGTNPTAEQLIAAGYELQDFKESTITGQYVKKLVNNN